MRKLLAAALLCAAMLMVGMTYQDSQSNGTLVTEIYVVAPGDSLWKISEQFIDKNTFGPRNVDEFYYGIIELNYELFSGRTPGMIFPGDRLQINYWVKGGETDEKA